MKVTVNFGQEIDLAVQQHLDGGDSVQAYIRGAVRYFNIMLAAEQCGNDCGYGDKSRFRNYNTHVSPSGVLKEE